MAFSAGHQRLDSGLGMVGTKASLIHLVLRSDSFEVYVGETGRNLGVRVGEHTKEVEAKDISRYTRQSKRSAEEQENKSAITVSQTMQRKKIT